MTRLIVMYAIVALHALSLLPGYAAAPKPLPDKAITLAVEAALTDDPGLSSHRIDVQTVDGIVVLIGMVDDLLAQERALQWAERVKGVRAVVNGLHVRPVARTDAEVRHDVQQALLHDPATEAYEVAVQVQQGDVTLTGTVQSWQEWHLSAQVAKSVKGVIQVHNAIAIAYQIPRPDYEIQQEIERRLAADVWVEHGAITVAVDAGKVTLRGAVGSAAEKSRAAADAWVTGVQAVDASALDVQWWRQQEMRRESSYTPTTDQAIAQALRQVFQYDPRLTGFRPEVLVLNGVVTLSGVVGSLAAKQAAADDAHNTVGVWHVRNMLRVSPELRPQDSALIKGVRAALTRDPSVDRHTIQVTARSGEVTLTGTVMSLFEKTQAERVAARVPGVVHVINDLEILSTTNWKSD